MKHVVTLLLVLLAVSAAPPPSLAQPRPKPAAKDAQLQRFASRWYVIHTNLTREEALPFGKHMDAVFDEYAKRFSSFGNPQRKQMPLYLFRTQEQYLGFLASHGLNAQNTEGIFFIQPGVQGLATWVQGKPYSQTFAVLQHEGFHQFAYHYIGTNLPTWVNEGLAQYFEDGVLVGEKMYIGFANGRRIASVRSAMEGDKLLNFTALLSMDEKGWHETVTNGPQEIAGLLYDQSWSIVFFLITADNGRYRKAFEQYLHLVADGQSSAAAFRKAFNDDAGGRFRDRWLEFARKVQPDPISTAITRMEFLAQGLLFMKEQNAAMPTTIEELKTQLRRVEFRVIRSVSGVRTTYHASDESLYVFPRTPTTTGEFTLLEAERDGLPPRISAPGLKPEPTLIWRQDAEGQLQQDILFR